MKSEKIFRSLNRTNENTMPFLLLDCIDPEPYQSQMRNAVFDKARDKNGYYVSAISGKKSKNKADFDIDHIQPYSRGKNNTILKNLRLVLRGENKRKGNRYE
ncbi:MAG: hypothetical protein A2X47_00310 [Lentisphaerae bacterium GWF2_38_69]|nr:MAG: hypothetical protein A2X47_00310 [Lentisphaerae bacterium GWF2_38_69]